jgi:hypothetical protein
MRATRSVFERVALSEEFIEFLTLPAYEGLLRTAPPLKVSHPGSG